METSDSSENEIIITSYNAPTKKKAKTTAVRRKQKFKKEWLSESDFGSWLIANKKDVYKAECKIYKKSMTAELCVIRAHSLGKVHIRNLSVRNKQTPITTFMSTNASTSTGSSNASHRAELKLCAFIAEHNISLRTMNQLIPLLKSVFPDSRK